LEGTWVGTLDQNVGSSGYSMVLSLTQQSGQSDYPGLNCGGTWTRVGATGEYTFFAERITHGRIDQGGRCLDGTLTVAIEGSSLAVGWFGTHRGKPLVAWGLLQRKR
jgi:hypothetical protein